MTTQIEALKMALEAFETLTQYNMVRANIFRRFEPTCTGDYVDLREFRDKAKPAITAIKEILAQQSNEQVEPVAWRAWFDADNSAKWLFTLWPEEEHPSFDWQPLYTTPPPVTESHKRKPLTDEEIFEINNGLATWMFPVETRVTDRELAFARAIEAAHGIKP